MTLFLLRMIAPLAKTNLFPFNTKNIFTPLRDCLQSLSVIYPLHKESKYYGLAHTAI